jgi:hypothetical protein
MTGFSDIQDNVWLNNAVLKRQVTLYQTSLFDPVIADSLTKRFQWDSASDLHGFAAIALRFLGGKGVR